MYGKCLGLFICGIAAGLLLVELTVNSPLPEDAKTVVCALLGIATGFGASLAALFFYLDNS